MAERMLCICWDAPVRGREERALESFDEGVGLFGRMQQEGRLERFEVVLLEPHGDLGGFMLLVGSASQVAALREDEEFRRVITNATLVVDGMRVVGGYAESGVAEQTGRYREALARMHQMA